MAYFFLAQVKESFFRRLLSIIWLPFILTYFFRRLLSAITRSNKHHAQN